MEKLKRSTLFKETHITKPHPFIDTNLQSMIFNWRNVRKHFTLAKVLTALTTCLFFFFMRTYIISADISIKIIFLEDFLFELKVWKDLFIGLLSTIFRLGVTGFWEELLNSISPDKLPIGPTNYTDPTNLSILTMDKGNNPGPNSKQNANIKPNPDLNDIARAPEGAKIMTVEEYIKKDTREITLSFTKWGDELRNWNEMPLDYLKSRPGNEDILISLLQNHASILNKNLKNRVTWLQGLSKYVLDKYDVKTIDFEELEQNFAKLQNDLYFSKIDKTKFIENKTTQVRTFYVDINQYRTAAYKELNKAENLILGELRKCECYRDSEVKRVINVEFIKAKKEFITQDGYLRAKVSEILKTK